MNSAELRSMTLKALRDRPDSQFADVCSYVGTHLKPQRPLEQAEKIQLYEVFWELMVQGILAPGHVGYQLQVMPTHATDYGRKCLEEGEITPHDPDGFLAAVRDAAGGEADEIVITYVSESLQCFLHREYLASTVLLGVASERCIDLIAEAYLGSLADDAERDRRRKQLSQTNRSVSRRFGRLRDLLTSSKDLPKWLKEGLDIQLSGIFEIIRRTRNDAGHPRGEMPGRQEAHACLLLFPGYYKMVYNLCEHLRGPQTEDSLKE